MSDNNVKLLINGSEYAGWKTTTIRRSIEALSGSFTLSTFDKWTVDAKSWPIFCGDQCSVKIGNDTVISGYVDDIEPSFDESSRGMTVSGRDFTADLIDCSAVHKPGKWKNYTAFLLIDAICRPFGIDIFSEVSTTTKYPLFAIQQGETAFEAIERICKLEGVIATSDPCGGLVITRPGNAGTSSTVILQGKNIKSAGGAFSFKERYSRYIVKGQAAGTDYFSGKQAAQVTGEATDLTITRYRPLVVIAEAQCNAATAKKRAGWEAINRAARSGATTVCLAGWRQDNGALWIPNMLVPTVIPYRHINSSLLITEITYQIDESGSTVSMVLKRPDALIPPPAAAVKVKSDPWADVRTARQTAGATR